MSISWDSNFENLARNGVEVPTDGTEDEAVVAVTRQLADAGVTADVDSVRSYVQQARSLDGATDEQEAEAFNDADEPRGF